VRPTRSAHYGHELLARTEQTPLLVRVLTRSGILLRSVIDGLSAEHSLSISMFGRTKSLRSRVIITGAGETIS